VPTYQRKDVVCDVVSALSRIDYPGSVEVIVVIDGSTDGTAAALAGLDCCLPLRVIEQVNRGAAHARNRGASRAIGDILLFLDDDMICAPDVIEQHARMYRSGADAVLGDFPVAPGSRPGFLSDTIADRKVWERNGPITPYEVFTGHLSVRRSVFEALGGFDEAFTAERKYGNEDIDFGVGLVERYVIRRNPHAISHQRSLVGPREYMRRARSAARADLLFAAKHPHAAEGLFEYRGASKISKRLRLLSSLPIFPRIFAEAATWTAEIGLHTPFRSSRKLSWLFNCGYLLTYWSTVRRNSSEPFL
jgi:glycosyltransferase involved in cell wall biosynthesis